MTRFECCFWVNGRAHVYRREFPGLLPLREGDRVIVAAGVFFTVATATVNFPAGAVELRGYAHAGKLFEPEADARWVCDRLIDAGWEVK